MGLRLSFRLRVSTLGRVFLYTGHESGEESCPPPLYLVYDGLSPVLTTDESTDLSPTSPVEDDPGKFSLHPSTNGPPPTCIDLFKKRQSSRKRTRNPKEPHKYQPRTTTQTLNTLRYSFGTLSDPTARSLGLQEPVGGGRKVESLKKLPTNNIIQFPKMIILPLGSSLPRSDRTVLVFRGYYIKIIEEL